MEGDEAAGAGGGVLSVAVEATHAPAVHVDPVVHVHDVAAPPAVVDDAGHAVHVVPSLRYSFTLHDGGDLQASADVEPAADVWPAAQAVHVSGEPLVQ